MMRGWGRWRVGRLGGIKPRHERQMVPSGWVVATGVGGMVAPGSAFTYGATAPSLSPPRSRPEQPRFLDEEMEGDASEVTIMGQVNGASKRFLDAFAKIETAFRTMLSAPEHESFPGLVRGIARMRSDVRRREQDLLQYARLRNAIVHDRGDRNEVIAEPHVGIVESIEDLARRITSPPRLDSLPRVEVHTCEPGDTVMSIAQRMYEGDFSQLPVYEGGVLSDLVTTETITRWLGGRLREDGGVVLDESVVADVLPYRESSSTFKVVARDVTVVGAIDAFEEAANRGQYLDAIVVTHSGQNDQRPLNIITLFDLPRLSQLAAGSATSLFDPGRAAQ